jgi:uncharacterized membrane protein YeaQ/YmgE (transglycosylase-associated protein family)
MPNSLIGTILIGFVVGLLARLISRDPRNPQGCLLTTFLGIAGAALFSWLGQWTGLYDRGEYAGFIGATIGAIFVLAIWRVLIGNR